MDHKHRYRSLIIFSSIVISLGLVSFVSCVIAEFKKAKKEDIKLDNNACYLGESRAFGLGLAALICLVFAHIIANLVICRNFIPFPGKSSSSSSNNTSSQSHPKKPTITATLLLLISWIGFGLAVILLSTATSMSRRQTYGKGWLDHKCYLVKDGVYAGSGVLVLLSIAAALGSAISTISKTQTEKGLKVHAQVA